MEKEAISTKPKITIQKATWDVDQQIAFIEKHRCEWEFVVPALLLYNFAEHRSNMQQHPSHIHHQLTSDHDHHIPADLTYMYSPHLTEKCAERMKHASSCLHLQNKMFPPPVQHN